MSSRRVVTLLAGFLTLAVLAGSGAIAAALDAEMDADGDGLTDAFESVLAMSDPALADSDGDGLIDAAEDPDGDDLSNLGEQRFGTHPGNADSDGDGVADGREDSDGDGRSDAQQQDERRVPAELRPTTEMAWWDRSESYDDRCHSDAVDPELHPCSFGAPDGAAHVVLLGDSHALQWLPALAEVGVEAGWKVTALTKAACPPAAVEFGRKEVGAAASCLTWRGRALDWLASEVPDLVLLTGAGRVYNLLDARGQRLSEEAALEAWQLGLADTLEELPVGSAAVVLADTPLMRANPVSCLEDEPGDLSACGTPRALAIEDGLDEAERETAARSGAAFDSLNDLVCPYSPCPAVIGDVLVWRNADHITATFAEQLVPSVRDLVVRHLSGYGQMSDGPQSPDRE